jgi:hypothetical protein
MHRHAELLQQDRADAARQSEETHGPLELIQVGAQSGWVGNEMADLAAGSPAKLWWQQQHSQVFDAASRLRGRAH